MQMLEIWDLLPSDLGGAGGRWGGWGPTLAPSHGHRGHLALFSVPFKYLNFSKRKSCHIRKADRTLATPGDPLVWGTLLCRAPHRPARGQRGFRGLLPAVTPNAGHDLRFLTVRWIKEHAGDCTPCQALRWAARVSVPLWATLHSGPGRAWARDARPSCWESRRKAVFLLICLVSDAAHAQQPCRHLRVHRMGWSPGRQKDAG